MRITFWQRGLLVLGLCLLPLTARATPSTQVWIPSTDIQKFGTVHLNYDTYARPGKATVLMLGPELGLLPFSKLQAEVGLDLMFTGASLFDDNPLYFNGKLATPEDTFFAGAPALALGIYNVGIKTDVTNQNITYALASRSLPAVGRLSAGYFYGNGQVLIDESGRPANQGVLLSWDRTIDEISDRLWLAADYQGSRSSMGALNFGAAWQFASNVSVILGLDHYLNQSVAGRDTVTVQLDINLPKPAAAAESAPSAPPGPPVKPSAEGDASESDEPEDGASHAESSSTVEQQT